MKSEPPSRTPTLPLLLRAVVAAVLPHGLGAVETHASRADSTLQRYGQVLSYLIYENTTYWTRSGLLLLAHTSLLGFTAIVLPPFSADALPERVLLLAVIGFVGLLLARFWWTAIKRGIDWIEDWHNLLLKLEPEAYGDIEFFRGKVGSRARPTRHNVRQVARRVAAVFVIIWAGTLAYALALVGLLRGLW
jgi:hypothetical protein